MEGFFGLADVGWGTVVGTGTGGDAAHGMCVSCSGVEGPERWVLCG